MASSNEHQDCSSYFGCFRWMLWAIVSTFQQLQSFKWPHEMTQRWSSGCKFKYSSTTPLKWSISRLHWAERLSTNSPGLSEGLCSGSHMGLSAGDKWIQAKCSFMVNLCSDSIDVQHPFRRHTCCPFLQSTKHCGALATRVQWPDSPASVGNWRTAGVSGGHCQKGQHWNLDVGDWGILDLIPCLISWKPWYHFMRLTLTCKTRWKTGRIGQRCKWNSAQWFDSCGTSGMAEWCDTLLSIRWLSF